MTPEKIALVRSSWKQVLPLQEAVARMFYERLFELDPSLRRLFRGDMIEQGRKLVTMLTMVVASLDRLDSISLDRLDPIVAAVEDLGRRHVGYGVTEAHYGTVGTALLWTLGQGLGDQFTAPVEAAWSDAYTTLASAMKQAAYAPA